MKKDDKGFELFYKNLSNRRKFIRTIWLTIIGMLVSAVTLINSEDKGSILVLVGVFAIVAIAQLFHTYRMFKRDNESER